MKSCGNEGFHPHCQVKQMTDDDVVIHILRNLQNGQSEIKQGLDNLRSDMNLQLAALNEKLSGQLLSEIEEKPNKKAPQ